MEKRILTGLLTVFFAIGIMAFTNDPNSESCKAITLRKKCEKMLHGYKYDSSLYSKIHYKGKKYRRETEVPLFFGEKYKIVFNTECLPVNVQVEVYNKSYKHSKRKLLFSFPGKTDANGTKIASFEPKRGTKLFIDYKIPPAPDNTVTFGRLYVMLGYKL